MKRIGNWFAVLSAITLSACETAPLPQHVTGFDTYEIVQRARCEVRDAIRNSAAKFVSSESVNRPDLSLSIKNGTITLEQLRRTINNAEAFNVINRYAHAAVAYEFEFDMTVLDKLGGSLGYANSIGFGPITFGLEASRNRTRKNTRVLKISDTFSKLSDSLKNRVCENISGKGRGSYPITGELGLDDIVLTFLDLNQSGNLVGDNQIPTITDTISFTTILSGGINPALTLVAISNTAKVTGATIQAIKTRTDIHKLTIVVALPPKNATEGNTETIAEQRAFRELELQRQRRLDDDSVTLRTRLVSEN